ncbi:MAG: hypothetical protein GY735_23700 [Delftia sp.]|nr:hypothetical protein [Delftia sp.]
MKEKIIEILKAKTMMLGDESGNGYLDSDEFNEVSTQIVKLFDIPYVSNRRELLAYHKWYLKNRSTVSNSEPKYMVEIYLRQ